MENLAALRHFVSAVELGSISAAARRAGLTQPAVSQQIAALESAVGQSLVVRTRSGVRLTEAGRVLLRHGQEILHTVSRMQDELSALSGEVAGPLKITANILFCQTLLVPVLGDLRRNFPKLKVELLSSDDLLDLDEHAIDIAIRSGSMGQGAGIVRRIGSMKRVLVASPTYLERVGRPKDLADLKALDFIQYKDDPSQQSLTVVQAGVSIEAPITTAFAAQMPNLVLHAAMSDFGFATAPLFLVEPMLADGRLERVLPDIEASAKNIYLVQQPHIAESQRARLFVSRLLVELSRVSSISLTPEARAQATDYLSEPNTKRPLEPGSGQLA